MLQCPVTLHLVAPGAPEDMANAAESLRHEHIAIAYAAASPAAGGAAAEMARLLDVSVRVDEGLTGLDVAHFGHGARPSAHCVQALEDIADLHRGEHVLVIGDVPAAQGETNLRLLEIGDDGWGALG